MFKVKDSFYYDLSFYYLLSYYRKFTVQIFYASFIDTLSYYNYCISCNISVTDPY